MRIFLVKNINTNVGAEMKNIYFFAFIDKN